MDAERLNNEVVQGHIKFIQEHLDYLVGISTDEHAQYDDPTTITLTFSFLKKRVEH